jgi:hypothetical protein
MFEVSATERTICHRAPVPKRVPPVGSENLVVSEVVDFRER